MGDVQTETAPLLVQLIESAGADPVSRDGKDARRAMKLRDPRKNVVCGRRRLILRETGEGKHQRRSDHSFPS
jgi:hypothetical protein